MSSAFSGRRFVITGAAKGIGRACVGRLFGAGAQIACLDRDVAALETLPDSKAILRLTVDVVSEAAVNDAIARAASAFGGLDGVINGAGIDLLAPLEETSDEAWRNVFAVNLDGAMRVCRSSLPHLRQTGGGTIVNISSAAGLQPLRHRTAYASSKAALQMFSKSLAMEAAEFGVRVNAVCPGAVETDLLRSSIDAAANPDEARASVRARYALGRIATSDEIAAAVLWLSSPESSYVTGTAMAVDGGRTFH
jgi:NAD(P)-dependent dehydrogenase (short-subunit alcohol dehydrogenase family)